jgi:hypothetical protein
MSSGALHCDGAILPNGRDITRRPGPRQDCELFATAAKLITFCIFAAFSLVDGPGAGVAAGAQLRDFEAVTARLEVIVGPMFSGKTE